MKITKENKLIVASAAALALTASAVATSTTSSGTGDEGFGTLFTLFQTWLTGNLGKLLALVGFAGTFIVYMMTHKGSVLFVGLIISLIAGGMVGISTLFFDAGTSSFSSSVA